MINLPCSKDVFYPLATWHFVHFLLRFISMFISLVFPQTNTNRLRQRALFELEVTFHLDKVLDVERPSVLFCFGHKNNRTSSSRRNALCCTTLSTERFCRPLMPLLPFIVLLPSSLMQWKGSTRGNIKGSNVSVKSLCCCMLINIFTFTKLTFRNENLCKTIVNFMGSGSWLSSRFSGKVLIRQ